MTTTRALAACDPDNPAPRTDVICTDSDNDGLTSTDVSANVIVQSGANSAEGWARS